MQAINKYLKRVSQLERRAVHGSSISFWRVTIVAATLAKLTGMSAAAEIRLGELDLSKMLQDVGRPKVDLGYSGKPLSINKQTFEHGVGSHAASSFFVALDGRGTQFTAQVGMDDGPPNSRPNITRPIRFRVICDGRSAFDSGPVKNGEPAKLVRVDLKGVKTLVLSMQPVGTGLSANYGDWADATITYDGEKPIATDVPIEKAEVLTPEPPTTPRVNGARVVGVRPGSPLLYQIAATGERPMAFSADGLPAGVVLDERTGLITGTPTAPGTSHVRLHAKNALGDATAELRVEVGDRIALTPPMGWNSWNCFAREVSDEKVRAATDTMVASGLTQHGWTYINIDDCWQVGNKKPADQRRTSDGMVRSNDRFPDMKSLTDYVHAHGLKAGIYSSPGRSTCAGFEGSLDFEAADAKQYAAWGFDYLKYDWCTYGRTADEIRHGPNPPTALQILQHPYEQMHQELVKQHRDILFSLCQYGNGEVWKWGEQVGGNCWRTTGDIVDTWGSMSAIGFNEAGHEQFAGPGHWNDPDMLVVGQVGWGPKLHPTKLTPNEQYTHVTLWSMLSAPLLIGCDLTQLDSFTKGLLTNDEVIAVNQDALGRAAHRVSADDAVEVWAKPLDDGSVAVGLFNRDEVPRTIHVKWADVGVSGTQDVRDLWRQKSLGSQATDYAVEVGRHGAALLRLSPAAVR